MKENRKGNVRKDIFMVLRNVLLILAQSLYMEGWTLLYALAGAWYQALWMA